MSAAFFRCALRGAAFALLPAGLALSPAFAAPAAQKPQTKQSAAAAKSQNQGALQISGAWAREMMPAAKVGAGYFEIKNNGDKPIRLSAADSAIAQKVEIHAMSMEGAVMKMRRLKDGIEIPPHSGLSFKPGSYHLMFVNPKAPFKAGQSFKVRFSFSDGGAADVPFAVRGAAKGASAKAAPRQMNMKMRGAH